MICHACGTENPLDAKLCSTCGTNLVDPDGATLEPGAAVGANDATLAPGSSVDPDGATIAPGTDSTDPDGATIVPGADATDPDSATIAPGADAPDPDGATIAPDAGTSELGVDTIADAAPGATDGWSMPAGAPGVTSTLPAGFLLSERYEIVRLLGEGGMGSVYEAHDVELERQVAIKLIRPDLATQPDVLKRFKQELILAREVTHENVVRIFDMGTDRGLKFITMEYVDGRDLKSYILDPDHEYTPEEAAGIIVQVCRALNSAHSNGVVHRDLKPQNIMIDADGLAQVMDFGVARSMELTGMTRTGELLGTPAYMSPEQAKSEPADARSDIFSLGIIFYELLTGVIPFEADTAFGTIVARTQEKAPPPNTLNPSIPEHINRVVVRCLETEPELRYQTVRDILQDLETRSGPRDHSVTQTLPVMLKRTSKSTLWAAGIAAIVVVGIGALALTGRLPLGGAESTGATAATAPDVEALSLAILPFRNASGDPTLDWLSASLAEMLRSDVGQSAELRTVSVDRISQILGDLKLDPNSTFDASTIAQLASFSNADRILVGQYIRVGDQIRIDGRLYDVEQQTETSVSAVAPTEGELLAAVSDLAGSVRGNLDLSADAVRALEAASFTPSSQSIDALRLYSEGLQLGRQGNYADALSSFEAATAVDRQFALAFSQLAQTHANLGFDVEAEQASRTAMELSDGLPDFERYLISARHYSLLGDQDSAIASYQRLLEAAPEDPELHLSLAGLYENTGALDEAYTELGAVLRYDPNYVEALYVIGRVEVRRGNAQPALSHFNQALGLTLDNDEARARILNGIGNTYRRLGELDQALDTYREALEINRRLDQKVGIAANLTNVGHLELAIGNLDQALTTYSEALDLRREISDREGIGYSLLDLGNVYLDMGRADEALQSYRDSLVIQRDLGNELDEALCLNNIAAVYMERGDYGDALTNLEQALRIYEEYDIPEELGLALYNLGETTTNLGQFDEALDYYLGALDQWRVLDDDLGVAWARVGIGIILGYQGRFGSALDSMEEAVTGLESSGEQGYWQFIVTANHGLSLGQSGLVNDAAPILDEALTLARGLESPALIAQALNFQGINLVYLGQAADARARFDEAAAQAAAGDNQKQSLNAQLHLDTLAMREGRHADAVDGLTATAEQANTLGLRYIATEAQIRLAEALLETGDATGARREVQTALNTAERLQLDALQAECYFILARADAADGDAASATRRFGRTVSLLEAIRDEAGERDPLQRRDLAAIYEAARQGAGAQ